MLSIILTIYSLVDITFLIFLYYQYKQLIKSEEYNSESLMNKFILGFVAIGGIVFVLTLLLFTLYYTFNPSK
jgi:uncharacterized BrkB/YihY/UPF0761 family membrane protein